MVKADVDDANCQMGYTAKLSNLEFLPGERIGNTSGKYVLKGVKNGPRLKDFNFNSLFDSLKPSRKKGEMRPASLRNEWKLRGYLDNPRIKKTCPLMILPCKYAVKTITGSILELTRDILMDTDSFRPLFYFERLFIGKMYKKTFGSRKIANIKFTPRMNNFDPKIGFTR